MRDPQTGVLATRRYDFALDARGDVRLTAVDGVDDVAYDAAAGVERSLASSASMGTGAFPTERRGLAPGLPDYQPAWGFLPRELGAAVRALAAAGDARVEETTVEGRPAWRLVAPLEPNTIAADADRIEVTVDRQSGLPLALRTTLRGEVRQELRLEGLTADAALPADAFTVPVPPGGEVARSDAGFRRVPLARVRDEAGYAPFVPSTPPEGFALADVAVASRADATAGGANPPSRGVVALGYRRGLAQVVVTTRRAVEGDWRDPFAVPGVELRSQPVRLQAGALAGADASLVVDPRSVPHLWLRRAGLIVTVSGDLTADELVAVAQSLERAAP